MNPTIELKQRSVDHQSKAGNLVLVVRGGGIEIEVSVFASADDIERINNAVRAWHAAHQARRDENQP